MGSSTLCGTAEPPLEVASETPNSSESELTPVSLPNEQATSENEKAISDNVCTDSTSSGTRQYLVMHLIIIDHKSHIAIVYVHF